jgi:DNA (cytosine-5)-methyltransferase 1
MKELSLFTGIGGGLIASRLLGWNTVCAVEINPFCRQILQCRQVDGCLEQFPIYDDIHEFDGHLWKDKVDIVSGGFPCQFWSHAARGRNNAPDLWPEMLRIVKEVQPTYVFAENVQDKPISRAADHLYELGYSCRYLRLSAADLGAPHQRNRYWLIAYADPNSEPRCPEHVETPGTPALPVMEWWQDDTGAMGVHDGLSCGLDRPRLQSLGNAQVPACAAYAWRILSNGFI